ncbi:MAG: peptide chain release factor N(5)-glutamine methyltransferase [Candidatus Magasanikiibacteriota bacterium]
MPKIKQILEQSNINIIDAEIIIAHVLKKPREFVIAHPEMKIERLKDLKIKKIFKQRKQDIPLAYLTGHKEFYGLNFIVNKHTLIPRPETEILVESVLKKLSDVNCQMSDVILIDIGTGSGCIPISIINQIRKSELSGYLDCYAIDISANALTVAKKNARQHKVKIKFLHGDLLTPITKTLKLYKLYNFQLIITANLPYLTPQQFKSEPSIQHEPKLALVAGKDGLKYYEKLLKQIVRCQMSDVRCFFEIDPRQTKIIKQLIKKYLPKSKITIHKDLAGLDRMVLIEQKNLN